MDNNDKKLKFIEAMTKHGLAHFDSGGIAGAVGSVLGTNNDFQAAPGASQQQLSNSYGDAQTGLQRQQDFVNLAAAQNGFGNQSNVFAQQQALANQLQKQANGEGPNPALAQLNQTTGQNVSNQAALAAGQRGAGANVGLMARQAAQAGAGAQQNAVGQAATLGAQQQIAAQSALANQQAQLQGVAANQIATQGQGTTNLSSASQGEQNILQNANTAANQINAGVAAGNQRTNAGMIGGAVNAVGSVLGLAKGGVVKMAVGGLIPPALSAPSQGPTSFAGQWLNSSMPAPTYSLPQDQSNPFMQSGSGGGKKKDDHITNDSKPSGVSELTLPALGSSAGYKDGGKVEAANKSQKAVVNKDSYANDKIPAMLSQGELVIDKDTMNDKGPMGQMARALAAHISKRNAGKK